MPYRAMLNIINFIQAVDYVVPGFAAEETLLYSPELKFYSRWPKTSTQTSEVSIASATRAAGQEV